MHVRSASTAARYANLTSLTNPTYRRSYRWRIWMALMSHAQMHVQCERGVPEQLNHEAALVACKCWGA
jgi:hypothetical protein